MSREIKFRARITGSDQFICGLPNEVYGNGWDFIHSESGQSEYIDIDTLDQYTGLKDKNGVEIYEGDILKLHTGIKSADDYMKKVVFFESSFCLAHTKDGIEGLSSSKIPFCLIDTNLAKKGLLDKDASSILEVIGNIHQNPELL